MASDFYRQKQSYAATFFQTEITHPEVINTCCRDNRACEKSLTSVALYWLPAGEDYQSLGPSTGFDPKSNRIIFAMTDQRILFAKYKEEIDAILIHELGHACNHALFPNSKLGMLDAVEKIGGKDIAECFRNPKDSGDFPFGPPEDGSFSEPLAEIAFARYRPLAIQWTSCQAFMYKLGLKCFYATGLIQSKLCH